MSDLTDNTPLGEVEVEEKPLTPIERLWLAVINRALLDALYPIHDVSEPMEGHCKTRAETWISDGLSHYRRTCIMAGKDPKEIQRKYKRLKEETNTTNFNEETMLL